MPEEGDALGELGYLRRTGIQYHWVNKEYGTFDGFLMDLKQSKRNNIRKVTLPTVAAMTFLLPSHSDRYQHRLMCHGRSLSGCSLKCFQCTSHLCQL
jgi:hypothetical protein